MNWSEEKYAKLYIRDTVTWLSWPWQARAVFPLLLRKVDGAGIVAHGRVAPAVGIGLLIGIPVEVVEPALEALLADGTAELTPAGVLLPNYLVAQEARKSDRLRSLESRERRRNDAQSGAAASHGVTKRHNPSPSSPAQPSPAQPEKTLVDQEAGRPPSDVVEVFEHWRTVMATPRSILDKKRRAAVQARLAEGRTVEDLKAAIDGCAKTPHNMGVNDRGEKFNDLELICRNGPNVERFMRNAQAPPRGASTSAPLEQHTHTGRLEL